MHFLSWKLTGTPASDSRRLQAVKMGYGHEMKGSRDRVTYSHIVFKHPARRSPFDVSVTHLR